MAEVFDQPAIAGRYPFKNLAGALIECAALRFRRRPNDRLRMLRRSGLAYRRDGMAYRRRDTAAMAKVFDQSAIAGRYPLENLAGALIERAASSRVGNVVPALDNSEYDSRAEYEKRLSNDQAMGNWRFLPSRPRDSMILISNYCGCKSPQITIVSQFPAPITRLSSPIKVSLTRQRHGRLRSELGERVMCCSSAASSPMAEYLKSQTPQELWKASIEPPDPLKPKSPFDSQALLDPSADTQPLQAAKAPGTGLLLDTTA
jgi:hypothetical protein